MTWRVFFFLGVVSSRFLLFGSTNLRQNTIEEEKGSCQQRLKGVFFYTSRSDFGVPFKLDFRWSMREMVHMG